MNTEKLLEERGSRYGSFASNAAVSQGMFNIVLKHNASMSNVHLEAIKMILHKIARMTVGDPDYLDNIDDIIGYATLLRDFINDSKKSD